MEDSIASNPAIFMKVSPGETVMVVTAVIEATY